MQYDLATIIASPRGMPALRHLLSELPSSFSTPLVCLVQSHQNLLADLQAATRLKVCWAEPGIVVQKGFVYLSRPGTSLVCRQDGTLGISPFGVESSALNPVDILLMSAASVHRRRLLTLVLAGFDHDGVAGCDDVKRAGGTVLILDRATARYWGMAEPIVQAGAVDRVLNIAEVAEALRGCFTSHDLLHCAEIQLELAELLETAMRLSGTGMGHITRRAQGSDKLHIVVQRGLGLDFFEHFEAMSSSCEAAWCRAVRLKQSIVIPDIGSEPCHPGHSFARMPYRGEFAVPLLVSEPQIEARGALTTLFTHAHQPSRLEAADLDSIVRDAANLITQIP
jgi:CheB methylesterase